MIRFNNGLSCGPDVLLCLATGRPGLHHPLGEPLLDS